MWPHIPQGLNVFSRTQAPSTSVLPSTVSWCKLCKSRDGLLCSVITCCSDGPRLQQLHRTLSVFRQWLKQQRYVLHQQTMLFCMQLKLMSHHKLSERAQSVLQDWAHCNVCNQHKKDKRDIDLSQFDNIIVITHLSCLILEVQ